MGSIAPTTDDRITARARELADSELDRLISRTPASKAMFERASRSMPGGVASSFQLGDPYPLYLDRGVRRRGVGRRRSRVLRLPQRVRFDGRRPRQPDRRRSHRARRPKRHALRRDRRAHCVALAEELCRRFKADQVRFTNSGTESTMTAMRVARAATGRDVIAKIEGIVPRPRRPAHVLGAPRHRRHGRPRRSRRRPPSRRACPPPWPTGSASCRFNDAAAIERLFEAEGDKIAALIMEPVMMNIGIVAAPARLPRACPRAVHEVRRRPDLRRGQVRRHHRRGWCGRALRRAARPRLLGQVDRRRHRHRRLRRQGRDHGPDQPGRRPPGHLQRQPALGRGIARHAHEGAHARRLRATSTAAGRPPRRRPRPRRSPSTTSRPTSIDLGCKGCVTYRPEPLTNYRDFLETNTELYEASYPWMVNRGVFMTPGDEEQWTLSVQHTTRSSTATSTPSASSARPSPPEQQLPAEQKEHHMADRLYRNFIGGEAADAADGRTADLVDPSTGEVFATVGRLGPRRRRPRLSGRRRPRSSRGATRLRANVSSRCSKIADAIEAHAEEFVDGRGREHRQAARADRTRRRSRR